MKKAFKISGLISLYLLGISSCSVDIPQAKNPVEMRRSFNMDCDKVWHAAFAVATSSQNALITSDQMSGVLAFSSHNQPGGSQIYINVYVKCDKTDQSTTVFVIPRLRNTLYLPAEPNPSADTDFLDKLQQKLRG